jgi:hypothetical protein
MRAVLYTNTDAHRLAPHWIGGEVRDHTALALIQYRPTNLHGPLKTAMISGGRKWKWFLPCPITPTLSHTTNGTHVHKLLTMGGTPLLIHFSTP